MNCNLVEQWKRFGVVRRCMKTFHASNSLISYYLTNRILQHLKIPNHVLAQKDAARLIDRKDISGHFYLAQSYFLQNRLTEAEDNLKIFLAKYPNHADCTYLLAQIEVLTQRKSEAKECLSNLLQHSKRGKTWQLLSDLVDTPEDFVEYESVFSDYYPGYKDKCMPYDLICHVSNAAQRGNCAEFALRLWRSQLELISQSSKDRISISNPKKKYTDSSAAEALHALKKCLDKVQIPFFLISGTLLGCIREGKLLGHDKDIDIGVWDDQDIGELIKYIRNSGCFYILPSYSKGILVIRHVNGVTIDIFVHYREDDDYWHAGGKSKWHNSPFTLIEHDFLGDKYLIPENYDLNLTENYGDDWRIPKIDFDSALDTPNMEVVDDMAMQIYLYKKVIQAKLSNIKLNERYINLLDRYDVN